MPHDIRTPMNAIIGFSRMAMAHIGEREKAPECGMDAHLAKPIDRMAPEKTPLSLLGARVYPA